MLLRLVKIRGNMYMTLRNTVSSRDLDSCIQTSSFNQKSRRKDCSQGSVFPVVQPVAVENSGDC